MHYIADSAPSTRNRGGNVVHWRPRQPQPPAQPLPNPLLYPITLTAFSFFAYVLTPTPCPQILNLKPNTQDLAEAFASKKKQGLVQGHGSGYGGSGFKFDKAEDAKIKQARKSKAKVRVLWRAVVCCARVWCCECWV
jgi:hypothetical protein